MHSSDGSACPQPGGTNKDTNLSKEAPATLELSHVPEEMAATNEIVSYMIGLDTAT